MSSFRVHPGYVWSSRSSTDDIAVLALPEPLDLSGPAAQALPLRALPGVYLTSDLMRSYPDPDFARPILGRPAVAGRPATGLERELDSRLAGRPGAAVVLRWGPAAEWLIWPIPALLSPLACVFYPLAALPPWLQWVARLVPPSYVFEGMRAVVEGHGTQFTPLLICTALTALSLLLAGRAFVGVYHHAVRTGLIARYSAETVS